MDDAKYEENLRKHGIRFEEAASVFFDPLSLTVPDPTHSVSENRFVIIGHSLLHQLLVVVHTERSDKIRIISARPASAAETRNYERKHD